MMYTTTRNGNCKKAFAQIVTLSNASCGGLYIPVSLPQLKIDDFTGLSYQEIAEKIIGTFTEIPYADIREICQKALINFEEKEPVFLKNLESNLSVAELFHGPTLSFKDYPMQFLGQIIEYILTQTQQTLNIITATSGDTGSAAIHAFAGKQKVKIAVLHPIGKVTDFQRRQMTTVQNNNVLNIAINGTFDTCQQIVKQITNSSLAFERNISTVNSINWGRIMMQMVYYIWLVCKSNSVTDFYVPTGNFGNIFACYFLKKCGFENIGKLYISTNSNNVIETVHKFGILQKQNTVHTISPAVDISNPSNFERMLYCEANFNPNYTAQIYNNFQNGNATLKPQVLENFRKYFEVLSISEERTIAQIQTVYNKYGYMIDPHTALAFQHFTQNFTQNKNNSVIISTAAPCKFQDTMLQAIGVNAIIPKSNTHIQTLPEKFATANVEDVQNLIDRFFI